MHNHIGLSQDGAHGTIEELLTNMEEYNVEKAVLFATDEETKGVTYEQLNTKIIELQNTYPEKIIAFARIIPSAGDAAVKEFQRSRSLGVKGLKLKPVDGFEPHEAKILFELLDKEQGYPVLIHTAHNPGNQPDLWEDLIVAYPHLNFILAHGGKDDYRQCARIAKAYSNVYVDTSTLSYNRTRILYNIIGPHKLVFASDYPYSHHAIELAKYKVLIKDPVHFKMIMYDNAAKILGL